MFVSETQTSVLCLLYKESVYLEAFGHTFYNQDYDFHLEQYVSGSPCLSISQIMQKLPAGFQQSLV